MDSLSGNDIPREAKKLLTTNANSMYKNTEQSCSTVDKVEVDFSAACPFELDSDTLILLSSFMNRCFYCEYTFHRPTPSKLPRAV